MKIAFCLSGHVRNFKNWFPIIKGHLLDQLTHIAETDIFLHVWKQINTSESWGYQNRNDDNNWQSYDFVHDLTKLYQPKQFVIEDYEELRDQFRLDALGYTGHISSHLRSQGRILHYVPMFYKIWKCNQLVLNSNVQYDWVVRSRTDAYFNIPFNFSLIKPDALNTHDFGVGGCVSDIFWMAKPHINNVACDMYPNLPSILAAQYEEMPELAFGRWLTQNKIPTNYFDCQLTLGRMP